MADPSRALLRVTGAEARDWLQGLVTNDLRRLAPGAAVYAALLTPQGKYLYDFFLVEDGDGGVLIDVDAERAPQLLQKLTFYRLRRAVAVAPAEGLGVALLWGEGAAAPAEALAAPDPRDPRLGLRLYAADPEAALAAAGAASADRDAWDALRVAVGAPATDVELRADETYILEAGFDRLNGVDFRKGCYVGQEVTARMRHKTALRKGLVTVRVAGAAPPPGTEILTADGKSAGALYTVAGGAGLAHLRFDRAEGPLRAGDAEITADAPGSAQA
jgi:folate-binding protein YgfZ